MYIDGYTIMDYGCVVFWIPVKVLKLSSHGSVVYMLT